jgi:hypothetical protein
MVLETTQEARGVARINAGGYVPSHHCTGPNDHMIPSPNFSKAAGFKWIGEIFSKCGP